MLVLPATFAGTDVYEACLRSFTGFNSVLDDRRLILSIAHLGLLLLLFTLPGCDSAPVAPPADPAMQSSVRIESSLPPTSILTTPEIDEEPKAPLRRDGRVFIPQMGWMDEVAFWEMYSVEPHKLPDTTDLYAVHQLREEYEREQKTQGES